MSKIKHLYDVKELAELFSYDPETGIVSRRLTREPCGQFSGTPYLQTTFKGRTCGVHRIAWTLYHSECPTTEIDHINGDGADNRICNLRLATSAQNNQNRRLSSRNKTGVKGVFRVKWNKEKRWRVAVGHHDKYHITHFVCFGQAIKHAADIRSKLHEQFARF